MKLVYVRSSERDGAKFWLKRVGWEPSEVVKKIAQENDPSRTGYVADIGGGHGRETLFRAVTALLPLKTSKKSSQLERKKMLDSKAGR